MTGPVAVVTQLWRFPVKSMRGETREQLTITTGGAEGDRRFALREAGSKKLADVRRTPRLLHYQSQLGSPDDDFALVTLPDGTQLRTDDPKLAERLSSDLDMKVTIAKRKAADELGFIDEAPLHISTRQTLSTLSTLNPDAVFDVRRFRANILLDCTGSSTPYPEDLWLSRILAIGRDVRLQVTQACGRCAMTSMEQDELPSDPSVLKTVKAENTGNLGIYATVLAEGTIAVGDQVFLE